MQSLLPVLFMLGWLSRLASGAIIGPAGINMFTYYAGNNINDALTHCNAHYWLGSQYDFFSCLDPRAGCKGKWFYPGLPHYHKRLTSANERSLDNPDNFTITEFQDTTEAAFKSTVACTGQLGRDGKCSQMPCETAGNYPVRYLGDLGYGESVNMRVYPDSCAEAFKTAEAERRRLSGKYGRKLVGRKKQLELYEPLLNMNCTFIRETDDEIERRFGVSWDGCQYQVAGFSGSGVFPGTRQEQWNATVPDRSGFVKTGTEWQKSRSCAYKRWPTNFDKDGVWIDPTSIFAEELDE